MTKLTFLGSGGAFSMKHGQSNMLLESDTGRKLLIDCGTDIRFMLDKHGYSVEDVHDVYISHLHADHVGGLEWLAFKTYFNPTLDRPGMFVNKRLSRELWERTLQGGLGSIQGKDVDLDDYFDVKRLDKNETFIWEGIEIQLVQVIHYMDGFSVVPSYGLMFKINDIRYFITTDAQHAPNQIRDFYNMSDVIFQDCETEKFKSGVHAHYSELLELPEDIRNKMWLYHYGDQELPDAVSDGFNGFVKQGQVFQLG